MQGTATISLKMSTAVVSVFSVFVYLCPLFLAVFANNAKCHSTICFNFFSRKIDINIKLFKDDEPLAIEDLIRQSGYPVQAHEIKTEDGYLLTYHRIPHGKITSSSPPVLGPPVLVQHGLLAASSAWVMAEQSLAFSLADAGFDVWLGNARGNTYSRKHVKLDPDKDKKKFWDFSWHEMGVYDLPAGIDYILRNTSNSRLSYIGHSMGTTMYFVMGSTRPEYMPKVNAAVALAPVIYPQHIKSPLANFLFQLHTILDWTTKLLGIHEVFPYSKSMFWLDQNICSNPRFQFICREALYFIGGFDDKELNRTSLTTVLGYMPAGASFKTLRHFRQINEKDANFKPFDFGWIENLWKYKSYRPPPYNLTNVNAPLYAYYGANDWLAVPEDVMHAMEHLPNVRKVTRVPFEQFNHLDFMWAVDAKALVYDDVISTLKNLSDSTSDSYNEVAN